MKTGYVYFFKHIGLEPIKIGYTESITPLSRFESLKTHAPYGAEIVGFFSCNNPAKKEAELHVKYASKRLSGEWFEISRETAENEIKFNTDINEAKKKSDFHLEYLKYLNGDTQKSIRENSLTNLELRDLFLKQYTALGENINISKFARDNNITRQTVHNWKKEFYSTDNKN